MEVSFKDLIDVDSLNRMVQAHYAASGVPGGILDAMSGEIYAAAGWQRICTQFHRLQRDTLARCVESDTHIHGKLAQGEASAYRCKNGLWDIGIPILCMDWHIATIFIGQFLYEDEELDLLFFRDQAERFGFDPEDYMAALSEVPILPRDRVDSIIEYNKSLADFLSSVVTHKWRFQVESKQRMQAEAMHADLFHHTTVGVVYQDSSGQISMANDAAQRILGLSLEQMQGRESVDPGWRAIDKNGLSFPGEKHPAMISLRTGKPQSDVVMGVFNPKEDAYRWILVNAVPQFHPGETRPYQVFTTFHDITHRILDEANLKEAYDDLEGIVRERTRQLADTVTELETLFNNTRVGLMSLRGGRILSKGNQRLADILGYDSPGEMVGLSIKALHLSEERYQQFGSTYYDKLSQGEILQVEYQLKRKDGAAVWCSLSGKALDANTPADLDKGVLWVVDDISARKAAEAALAENEKRYRTVFDQSPNAIVIVDPETKCAIEYNDLAPAMLGYSREEFSRLKLLELEVDSDPDNIEQRISSLLMAGKGEYETQMRQKSGELLDMLVSTRVITLGGRLVFHNILRDISPRKKTEAQLRFHAQIINQIHDSVIAVDLEGVITAWNQGSVRLFHYTAEEAIGKKIAILYPGAYHPTLFEEVIPTLLEQGSLESETTLLRKNGESFRAMMSLSVMRDADGRITGMIGYSLDITERDRAEKRLRDSEERFRVLFEQADDAIFLHDREGRFHMVNSKACQNLGYTENELMQLGVSDVDPEFVVREDSKRFWEDLPVRFNGHHLRKDGTRFPVEVRLSEIRLKDHSLILALVSDTTERLQTEQSLLYYESMVSNIDDLIALVDKDYVCRQLNNSYLRALGKEREAVIDQSMAEVLGVELFSRLEPHMEKSFAGETESWEMWISFPRWEKRYYRISSYPMRDGKNEVYSIAVVTHDITDLRKTQERLETINRELEQANKELDQFTNIVSHDLKSPLRAIHNYADFLHQDLQPTLQEDQKGFLQGVMKSAARAELLVNDLLELSRISRKVPALERINLERLLEDVISSFHLNDDVSIIMPEQWPSLVSQASLLRPIFQNLISNAIKYNTRSNKRIEIGWREEKNGHTEFFVKDNGIGIDPKYHQKIFGAFERLYSSDQFEGSGIGLAIVERAISKLRGAKRVDSEPDAGTTIYFSIPNG